MTITPFDGPFRRLRRVWQRRTTDRDMHDEMRAHIDMEAADLVREHGLCSEEALRVAATRFGGMERYKEESRDAWPLRWLSNLVADLRYGARSLRRTPVFTLAAVLALALGIGANAVVFGFVDSMFFRSLDVQDPTRLVALFGMQGDADLQNFSYPTYEDFARGAPAFADLAAFNQGPVSISDGGDAAIEWSMHVSDNYFSLLGVAPAAGRLLRPGDLRAPVVVLGYEFWIRRYAGDPAIVGKTIRVSGSPFTVVGVAPQTFIGTVLFTYTPSVWIPAGMHEQTIPGSAGLLTARNGGRFTLIGRLNAGVTEAQARESADGVARDVAFRFPDLYRGLHTRIISNRTAINPWLAPPEQFNWIASISLIGVVLVLFVACCNVMNLLLARMTVRRAEVAARIALGASPGRLIQQFLTESVLLSLLGGAVAIVVAAITLPAMQHGAPPLEFAYALQPMLTGRVMLYTAAICAGSAVVFGLAPALQAARRSVVGALRATPETRNGRSVSFRELLVVGQVAVSLVVIVAGALMVRSKNAVRDADPGFAVDGAIAFTVDPELFPVYTRARAKDMYQRAMAALARVPGVQSVSRSALVPLDSYGEWARVFTDGTATTADRAPIAEANIVTPGYFATIGTPILDGREFARSDSNAQHDVVVVNEVLAQRLWPSQSAIGKQVRLDEPGGPMAEVIGVARTSKYGVISEAPKPAIWRDLDRAPRSRTTIVVRASGDPRLLKPAVREAMRSVDPALPLTQCGTLREHIAITYSISEGGAFGALSFAILTALLTASGVFGVVSYAVSQRSREIGIRMALGATGASVIGLVLARSARVTLAGIAIGLTIALVVPFGLDRVLYGVSERDPVTLIGAVIAFSVIATAAAALPARRAARLDPVRVLRLE